MAKKMKQLNIKLTEKALSQLEQIRILTECDTYTETIKVALTLIKFLAEEKIKGAKLIIRTKTHEKEIMTFR